jgi:hypothetical protein
VRETVDVEIDLNANVTDTLLKLCRLKEFESFDSGAQTAEVFFLAISLKAKVVTGTRLQELH